MNVNMTMVTVVRFAPTLKVVTHAPAFQGISLLMMENPVPVSDSIHL